MLKNSNTLYLMSNYLKKTHRKLPNSEIYKSYYEYKKSKKLIGLKFYNQKLFNIARCRLLLDYVLISADMKVINKPFNLIYNQNTKRYEPCLVVLVAALEIDKKVYPIDFTYWVSKYMIETEEVYLKKTELAEKFISEIFKKYEISEIIFDAGFCVPKLLNEINKLGVKYTCRFPKSRKISLNEHNKNASSIFKNIQNNQFYYYHKNGYLNKVIGQYGNHKVQLVVVANTKQKLIEKDFYCLITNDLKSKYPTVLKNYKLRAKIEDLFKKLKTYLGITTCNRHNEDYVNDRIKLAFRAFVIVQEYSYKIQTTFHKTLKYLQSLDIDSIKNIVFYYSEKIFESIDSNAFESINSSETQVYYAK